MPLLRGRGATVTYQAWNAISNSFQINDVTNHTLKLVRDGVESSPINLPSELDPVGAPGIYLLSLLSTEMDAGLIAIVGKSATSGVSIIPTEITTA